MANTIPGADALGFGFNTLGNYGLGSVTSQIFAHKNNDAQNWVYEPTGIQYEVPDNIAVENTTSVSGQSYVFSSQQAFQSHFASSIHADISADFGTFQGAFNASYGTDTTTTGSYYYGVYEANYNGWSLVIEDDTQQWLSPGFTQDPDVQALTNITEFTPQNAYLFFRVFNKFGTHFVNQVIVGGKLYYYTAVNTSYSSNLEQIHTDISLEYKAVFVDTSVNASADWQTLGQQWSSSRKVSIDASGGDTGPLSALDPGYDSNYNDIFTNWQSAVMGNPAVIEFKLRPLSAIFSGDLEAAISQALTAYASSALSVMSNYQIASATNPGPYNYDITLNSQVLLNGMLIEPDVPPPPPPYPHDPAKPVGFQLAIFDGSSLAILLNKFYYMEVFDPPECLQVYDTMYGDVSAVAKPGCIVALAAVGANNYAVPTGSFNAWLQACGATLQQWVENQGYSGFMNLCSYVCVGQQGMPNGSAYEAYICEGQSENGLTQLFAWLQPPTGEGDGYTVNAGSGGRAFTATAD